MYTLFNQIASDMHLVTNFVIVPAVLIGLTAILLNIYDSITRWDSGGTDYTLDVKE